MGASIAAPGFTQKEPALATAPVATQAPNRDGSNTLLVDSPRFKLQYAIDDAGPNGAATVELWITQDGGRTWIRRADDPDRVSPIEVDLGGEGTYGLCLVARSASGLGDQPPAPGDPPQSWVEVDSTPPAVQLQPPQVGNGSNSGKVAIAWRVSDLHLPPRSVMLSWRADQPNAPLAAHRRRPGECRPVRLERTADRAAAVPSQGGSHGHGRPSRIGGHHRRGRHHGRSKSPTEPDHRP